ncbi:gamma-crystallin M2-like, partial [Scleropages formosus]|uniref:gamma-crystallin M2-like n=1 Tax=Scleropages formosus TaxID=113540 RepID=UPI0010FAAA2E
FGDFFEKPHCCKHHGSFIQFLISTHIPFQITFYEERNFGGRSYDSSSDCADLTSYMSHCYSCRVHSGCFMVYDRANYMGNQYFLRRGEYPDCRSMGMSDFFRSCRMIPMVFICYAGGTFFPLPFAKKFCIYASKISAHIYSPLILKLKKGFRYSSVFNRIPFSSTQYRGSYRMRIYERENFGGQMYELMDDCDNIMDRYRMSNCMSCHVMDGHWLMYEQPHYRGRMMYFWPGEYRNFSSMGWGSGMRFMSMRRIMDSWY